MRISDILIQEKVSRKESFLVDQLLFFLELSIEPEGIRSNF